MKRGSPQVRRHGVEDVAVREDTAKLQDALHGAPVGA
jgi:hypothetical protein